MIAYIIRRLMIGVIILLLVTLLVFLAMRLLPGDPLIIFISQSQVEMYSPAQLAELRQEYGLDESLPIQYINWLGNMLRGDMGKSINLGLEVKYLIFNKLPITIYFGVMSFIVSAFFGIIFGVICALRRGKWIDSVVTILANIGITLPAFWVGILLMYLFSLTLHWLPTGGYVSPTESLGQSLRSAIMPVICLSLFSVAALTRQTRSAMLEVVSQDYIRTAWSKGLRERVIILRHTIKNAMIPVITILGLQVGLIFGGSVLIETVFNIPGMGRLMADSLFSHDYQIVQAGTLVIAVVVVLSNLVVDISYGWFDPRIRYG
ncbi:MAG: peptide ABC transporter [Chloroflexi bacterium RBG_13_51_18]|nr:MAG: peptide ABC transporter [Chloroflexi bacterium RBG_13_51_18]